MVGESAMNYGDLERVIGYEAVDKSGNSLGKVSAIWVYDDSDRPEFVGIQTGWLMGKTCVAPTRGAEINRGRKRVRLPYTEEKIKGAPSYDPDHDLDRSEEQSVFNYYGETPQAAARESATSGAFRGTAPAAGRTAGKTGPGRKEEEEVRIPLRDEELKVGKREVEAGQVRLRKIVRTETVQQPVELKHEDVVIERTPPSPGTSAAGGQAFEQEEVYIPWRREEPVVEKQARVREEVRAKKTSEIEREQVRGQVRKEDVRIEKHTGDEDRPGTHH